MADVSTVGAARSAPARKPDAEDLAREVIRIRLSQLVVNERYKAGEFKVPIHLALGHEAIAAAVSAVMRDEDMLLLSHRNVAYNLARAGLRPLLDEYLLKPTGLAGGRYGSMNLLNPARGVVYTSSILGNQFPVGVGVAMGELLLDGGRGFVTVLAGDGSIEEGSIFEAAVMARSLDLPVAFLVENNEWSMATRIDERRRAIDLEALARATGLAYERLCGNDPFAYVAALDRIRGVCLARREPVLVEVTVTTLGDWRGPPSAEHPDGKFINYHAGPAPKIDLLEWPLLRDSAEDPVAVLRAHVPEDRLRAIAREEMGRIQESLA
jgi:pyruvate dehydrogenase E1 component alpha subunit